MNRPQSDPLLGLRVENRASVYDYLRREMPVYWSAVHAGWVLTRYDDVSSVLRHPRSLAVDVMPFLALVSERGGLDLSRLFSFLSSLSLLARPPRHDVIRKLLGQVLGNFRRTNLPVLFDQRARELLERGAEAGSIDLALGYGRELALFTVGTILGVPGGDLDAVGRDASNLIAVFERRILSISRLSALNSAAASMLDYFGRLIAQRRKEGGTDGLSSLIRLADEQLDCSDEDLAGFCAFFFVAAEETTAAAISSAALMLLERQSLQDSLRARPDAIAGAVREFLRLASPVQFIAREAGVDLVLGGESIKAGQPVMLMLAAANRDPVAFPNPDEPDPDRNGPEAVVFAVGPYRCVGSQLATFEIEVAVRNLLSWPKLRLSSDPPVWTERMNIAPLQKLTADFT